MRAADVNASRTGPIREALRVEDRPREHCAVNEVLVSLVFPVELVAGTFAAREQRRPGQSRSIFGRWKGNRKLEEKEGPRDWCKTRKTQEEGPVGRDSLEGITLRQGNLVLLHVAPAEKTTESAPLNVLVNAEMGGVSTLRRSGITGRARHQFTRTIVTHLAVATDDANGVACQALRTQLIRCEHLPESNMKVLRDCIRTVRSSRKSPTSNLSRIPSRYAGTSTEDFVEWGHYSLETVYLALKSWCALLPCTFHRRPTHHGEACQRKYGGASVWIACCNVFDYLNLAAIIDSEVLCIHGGLSPVIRTLDQIRLLSRAQEISHEGVFCDLMWSDPDDVENWGVSPRGAGRLFGVSVTREFNHINSLSLI
ncbi:Metallo-dependent phosphatase-like protein, partial [Russula dissimulans]